MPVGGGAEQQGAGVSGKDAADKRANKAAAKNARSRYRSAQDTTREGDAVDWRDVDPGAIASAVANVVAAGDAITFSRTRDGGAYSVTVLCDGLRHFHREHLAEDIEARLREIAEDAAAWVKAND